MIVAAEHFIDSDEDLVHHLLLYICTSSEYARTISNTTECITNPENGIISPGAAGSECATFVFGCKLQNRQQSG